MQMVYRDGTYILEEAEPTEGRAEAEPTVAERLEAVEAAVLDIAEVVYGG